jgi:hypothetical protein
MHNFSTLACLIAVFFCGCASRDAAPPSVSQEPLPIHGERIVRMADGRTIVATTYSSSRAWVEHHCATNSIPEADRIFIARLVSPRFAGVIQYHPGITIHEIVASTPLNDSTRTIEIYRSRTPTVGHCISLVLEEARDYQVEPNDLVCLYDTDIVIHR